MQGVLSNWSLRGVPVEYPALMTMAVLVGIAVQTGFYATAAGLCIGASIVCLRRMLVVMLGR